MFLISISAPSFRGQPHEPHERRHGRSRQGGLPFVSFRVFPVCSELRTLRRRASSLGTGSTPGKPRHTGQTCFWARSEFVGAAAPHLRLGLELDVGVQTDDGFVVRGRKPSVANRPWLNTGFLPGHRRPADMNPNTPGIEARPMVERQHRHDASQLLVINRPMKGLGEAKRRPFRGRLSR